MPLRPCSQDRVAIVGRLHQFSDIAVTRVGAAMRNKRRGLRKSFDNRSALDFAAVLSDNQGIVTPALAGDSSVVRTRESDTARPAIVLSQ